MSDRICHWGGCLSGARWRAHLHLECQAPGVRRALSMESTFECCDAHQDKAKLFLLSDANREIVTVKLTEEGGYPQPNFLTARVTFVPVEGSREIKVVVPCDRDGCTNPAKWQIRQVIPEIGSKRPRLKAMTNLCVCDKHKRDTRPKHLLDKESRAATYELCQRHNVMLPNLDGMTLEFEPLGAKMAIPVVQMGD